MIRELFIMSIVLAVVALALSVASYRIYKKSQYPGFFRGSLEDLSVFGWGFGGLIALALSGAALVASLG